jgi:hypothetical protein
MKLLYPTYVKYTDLDVHMRVIKKAFKVNGETVEADIINLFGFTLKDCIFEWGENYIQDHQNYNFEELEQAFYKRFKTMKNDEETICNSKHTITNC